MESKGKTRRTDSSDRIHHTLPRPYRYSKNGGIKNKTEVKYVPLRDHQLWHALVENKHPREALEYFIELYEQMPFIRRREAEIIYKLVGTRPFEEAVKYVLENFIHSQIVEEFLENNNKTMGYPWNNKTTDNRWDKREVCPNFIFGIFCLIAKAGFPD